MLCNQFRLMKIYNCLWCMKKYNNEHVLPGLTQNVQLKFTNNKQNILNPSVSILEQTLGKQ